MNNEHYRRFRFVVVVVVMATRKCSSHSLSSRLRLLCSLSFSHLLLLCKFRCLNIVFLHNSNTFFVYTVQCACLYLAIAFAMSFFNLTMVGPQNTFTANAAPSGEAKPTNNSNLKYYELRTKHVRTDKGLPSPITTKIFFAFFT